MGALLVGGLLFHHLLQLRRRLLSHLQPAFVAEVALLSACSGGEGRDHERESQRGRAHVLRRGCPVGCSRQRFAACRGSSTRPNASRLRQWPTTKIQHAQACRVVFMTGLHQRKRESLQTGEESVECRLENDDPKVQRQALSRHIRVCESAALHQRKHSPRSPVDTACAAGGCASARLSSASRQNMHTM